MSLVMTLKYRSVVLSACTCPLPFLFSNQLYFNPWQISVNIEACTPPQPCLDPTPSKSTDRRQYTTPALSRPHALTVYRQTPVHHLSLVSIPHPHSLHIDACTPPQPFLHTPSHNEMSVALLQVECIMVAVLCLAGPDFVYPIHFTRCYLQRHLQNQKAKYRRFLLNDSTGDEQCPRIQARFEYYL